MQQVTRIALPPQRAINVNPVDVDNVRVNRNGRISCGGSHALAGLLGHAPKQRDSIDGEHVTSGVWLPLRLGEHVDELVKRTHRNRR